MAFPSLNFPFFLIWRIDKKRENFWYAYLSKRCSPTHWPLKQPENLVLSLNKMKFSSYSFLRIKLQRGSHFGNWQDPLSNCVSVDSIIKQSLSVLVLFNYFLYTKEKIQIRETYSELRKDRERIFSHTLTLSNIKPYNQYIDT